MKLLPYVLAVFLSGHIFSLNYICSNKNTTVIVSKDANHKITTMVIESDLSTPKIFDSKAIFLTENSENMIVSASCHQENFCLKVQTLKTNSQYNATLTHCDEKGTVLDRQDLDCNIIP